MPVTLTALFEVAARSPRVEVAQTHGGHSEPRVGRVTHEPGNQNRSQQGGGGRFGRLVQRRDGQRVPEPPPEVFRLFKMVEPGRDADSFERRDLLR